MHLAGLCLRPTLGHSAKSEERTMSGYLTTHVLDTARLAARLKGYQDRPVPDHRRDTHAPENRRNQRRRANRCADLACR